MKPQVPKEDVDRKPVGGTKMDKDILARTMEQLRGTVIHKQVVSGREFKGRPFNSKPKLIHFKVSPPRVPPGHRAGGTQQPQEGAVLGRQQAPGLLGRVHVGVLTGQAHPDGQVPTHVW